MVVIINEMDKLTAFDFKSQKSIKKSTKKFYICQAWKIFQLSQILATGTNNTDKCPIHKNNHNINSFIIDYDVLLQQKSELEQVLSTKNYQLKSFANEVIKKIDKLLKDLASDHELKQISQLEKQFTNDCSDLNISQRPDIKNFLSEDIFLFENQYVPWFYSIANLYFNKTNKLFIKNKFYLLHTTIHKCFFSNLLALFYYIKGDVQKSYQTYQICPVHNKIHSLHHIDLKNYDHLTIMDNYCLNCYFVFKEKELLSNIMMMIKDLISIYCNWNKNLFQSSIKK